MVGLVGLWQSRERVRSVSEVLSGCKRGFERPAATGCTLTDALDRSIRAEVNIAARATRNGGQADEDFNVCKRLLDIPSHTADFPVSATLGDFGG